MSVELTQTQYGFDWGPISIQRLASIDGRVILRISTDAGKEIEVYCSAAGRSLRVFEKGAGEMKVCHE